MSERVTCPVCRRDIALTKALRLRHHDDPSKRSALSRFGVLCDGAGATMPEAEKIAERGPAVYGAGPGFN